MHRVRNILMLLAALCMLAAATVALWPAQRTTTHYTLAKGRIVYDGQMLKGKFSGRGTVKFNNGDQYHGQFKQGRFSGQGRFTSHAGWQYRGKFTAGQLTGRGTLTTKQGKILRGYFKNGQYHATTSTH